VSPHRADPVPQHGDRIELVSTTDSHTKLVPGDQGTVVIVDGLGSVHVTWDSGSRLALIPGEDEWKAAENG
jgi:Domain of unknown function (DUF4314)